MVTSSPTSGPAAPVPRRSAPAWTTRCRTPEWLNETNVKAALSDTSLEIETIDRALVRRTPRCSGSDSSSAPYDPGEIDAQAHGAVARTIGSQIAVLLKNDAQLLPLDPNAGSVVVIGQSKFVDEACLGAAARPR